MAPSGTDTTRFVKLDGFHHVTAITADAEMNLNFYSRVLGLRSAHRPSSGPTNRMTATHVFAQIRR
jgi:catechol 2,3-dioxygenase-like lactoylglutathione lyase family enzyme